MYKKITTGLVAFVTIFSMTLGLSARGASADTMMTTTTTTTTTAGFVYTRDLTLGSTGADVVALQTMLVAQGYLVIPVGVSMGYFGPLTKAALAKYQAANGISPAVGYFGPITRAYIAAHAVLGTFPEGCTSSAGFSTTTGAPCSTTVTLPAGCTSTVGYSPTTGVKCDSTTGGSSLPAGCTSTAGYSTTTGVKCDSGTGSNNNGGALQGGETSINNFDVSDADDSTIEEGDEMVDVAKIEFDVDDADAQLDRADLIFDGTGNDEDRPWDVFDRVYLLDENHDEIASMSSDSKSDWDETDDNDVYRIRFSDVGEIYREGDNVTLYVAVDTASSVDGADTSGAADWSVQVATDPGDENGLRFVDSEDINTEVGSDDTADFSIQEAGANSEFTVSEADSSPDATTLEVKETQTREYTIATFDLDADQDGGDVKLRDFPVAIEVDNASSTNVISDVYATIDGTKYRGDYTATSTSGFCNATTISGCTPDSKILYTFNDIEDDDVIISAGDSMEADVSVKFKSQGNNQANYSNNTTVQAFTYVSSNDVEDADSGDDIGDVSGTASGDEFGLAGTGLGVKLVSTDSDTSGDTNNIGEYTFVVDVTAFGDDQYVELSGARSSSSATSTGVGFEYLILNGSNAEVVAAGTSTVSVDADEDETANNRVKIDRNDTVRFTVKVFYDSATSDTYKARLYSVNFRTTTDADPIAQQVLFPENTYRTNGEFVNAI